jgi:hypothetical protein
MRPGRTRFHTQEQVMAKVRIEQVIDHLGANIRRALEETIRSASPEAKFDPHELFRDFKRNVARRCRSWEDVPNQYVDSD